MGDAILLVATDRLSAFDVVLPTPIPDKGRVLTQLSKFWFDTLRDVIPNHVITTTDFPAELAATAACSKAAPCFAEKRRRFRSNAWCGDTLPVPDGRIIRRRARICSIQLPRACANRTGCPIRSSRRQPKQRAATTRISPLRKPQPIVGRELAVRLREVSLEIYRRAVAYAEPRGIILADTKFEFGLDGDELVWIDEALTPDSSRFWPASEYEAGHAQPSFDKQYVRDYLERIGWNKQAPGPVLPADVVAQTRSKYREAYFRLTGHALD